MAQLKSVLGNFSGKMGGKVFYIKDGKTITANRPEHYNQKSESVKKNQGKFGLVNKFTSPVYSEKLIMEIWKKAADVKSERYKNMVSKNSEYFIDNRPTTSNVITPGGEENPISEIQYNSGKLNVKLSQQTTGKLIMYVVPINPVSSKSPDFIVLKTENTEITDQEFEVTIHPAQVSSINKYKNYIIYAAVVNGNTWTDTFAVEAKL